MNFEETALEELNILLQRVPFSEYQSIVAPTSTPIVATCACLISAAKNPIGSTSPDFSCNGTGSLVAR